MKITGDVELEITIFKKRFQVKFMVYYLKELQYFLGMEVARSHNKIFISQILTFLKKQESLK